MLCKLKSVIFPVRNRNIRPTEKWINNQLITDLWQRGNTYCATAKEIRKKKHRRACSVQPALYLRQENTSAGFLVLLFFVLLSLLCISLSPEAVIFILCADRDTNDLTYFSHWIAAIALKTHSFGRQHHQHHSLKAGKGQILQLDLHPHVCSESQCRAGCVSC